MYEKLFKRIIDASYTNSLTFFVGAGATKLSNAPTWSELIDAFCNHLRRKTKEKEKQSGNFCIVCNLRSDLLVRYQSGNQ